MDLWSGETDRFIEAMTADSDATLPVPTCPGWDVWTLAGHVAGMWDFVSRVLRSPSAGQCAWRPVLGRRGPVAARLRHRAADLRAALDGVAGDAVLWSWSDDHSPAFWARRIAVETAIHRWDAEFATGRPRAPMPQELAIAGIREFVEAQIPYHATGLPGDGAAVRFAVDGYDATVVLGPDGVKADPTAHVACEVTGEPTEMLLYLWGRPISGSGLRRRGRPDLVDRLRAVMHLSYGGDD